MREDAVERRDQEVEDLLAKAGEQYEVYLALRETVSLVDSGPECVQVPFNWDNLLTWQFKE